MDARPSPLLELRDIVKRFPGVVANDCVSLALAPGEVLGVLGENGAGKTTLMNVASGLLDPDEGEIVIDGRATAFASARDAIQSGIGMVHQHFMLVPTLTVVENVVLGDRRLGPGRLALDQPARRIRALSAEIGLPVDPFAIVGQLGVGGRQRVEIIKALYRDARVLILDEPTAVLSRHESRGLFAMIRKLSASGIAVLLTLPTSGDPVDRPGGRWTFALAPTLAPPAARQVDEVGALLPRQAGRAQRAPVEFRQPPGRRLLLGEQTEEAAVDRLRGGAGNLLVNDCQAKRLERVAAGLEHRARADLADYLGEDGVAAAQVRQHGVQRVQSDGGLRGHYRTGLNFVP
jgi:ABC-type branched-subunit amino acid transport system ATPase component